LNHAIKVAGPAYELRPVGEEDAAFICAVRNDPEHSRFLHPGASNESEQRAWLAAYFDRPGDYYFLVQAIGNGNREGVVGIYNVDVSGGSAEWGRWVIRKQSLAAVESCYLTYCVGFDVLGLAEMYCRTLAENEKVVAFHSSLGLATRRIMRNERMQRDVVEQVISRELWTAVAPRLLSIAERLADARRA
jgi:RimJ/RimL family protein N-acetyltransferase